MSMTVAKALSLRIRERLVRLEMTQGRLAELIGMTPTALSARMRGEREFRLSEIATIADVLQVTLVELVGDDAELEVAQ